mgnify:CR=1 FL=1
MTDSFLCLGNFTLDIQGDGVVPGGSVFYSGSAAQALGMNVRIVAGASRSFHLQDAADLQSTDVKLIDGSHCTTMENVYTESGRKQYVHAEGPTIPFAAVPSAWLRDSVVLLCPVFGELETETARRTRGLVTGASVQGWLRKKGEGGRVECYAETRFLDDLQGIDVLFFSVEDLGDHPEMVEQFKCVAPIVVETRGPGGANVTMDNTTLHFPAQKIVEVDPTGAGDTFAAAFLAHYVRHRSPPAAAEFAVRMAEVMVERVGPLTGEHVMPADGALAGPE